MSSGMFRGKESSNRIELSRLVQELLNFGVLGSLRLWVGWEMDGDGGWLKGAPHTRTHARACMHTYACTRMHAHAHVLNMIISCKWPPPLGESLGILYDVIRVYACMCVCVHMCGGHPLTTPHPHPPTPSPPKGGTPGITQNSIALELIEIFQFRLKI